MHRHPSTFAAAFAALLVLTVGATGHAADNIPVVTSEPDGYGYQFKDDSMTAGFWGPRDARISIRPQAARSVLIRPRTQFIAQLLKSVEEI